MTKLDKNFKIEYAVKIENDPLRQDRSDRRTLVDLAASIVELDPEAKENEEYLNTALTEVFAKVDRCIYFWAGLDMQEEFFRNEKKHFETRLKSIKWIRERMKRSGVIALETLNAKELQSESGHKIRLQESSEVEILDLEKLPDWAKRITTTIEPDKVAIKKAIKEGKDVPGAILLPKKFVVFK